MIDEIIKEVADRAVRTAINEILPERVEQTQKTVRFVKAKELAKILGVSTSFIQMKTNEHGGLPSYKLDFIRLYNIDEAVEWLQQYKVGNKNETNKQEK